MQKEWVFSESALLLLHPVSGVYFFQHGSEIRYQSPDGDDMLFVGFDILESAEATVGRIASVLRKLADDFDAAIVE
ncbi:MAG: hypothetical protein UY09_C0021G0011 [Parcubacteria group bacterium GW2011_GWA2_47_8]|nr:MAG: hypothetical protein UY09_C0021G0011 [Parcubacteria group bacterium GW2011_GWA2_47_8]